MNYSAILKATTRVEARVVVTMTLKNRP